uniref:Uncharacterized protein n=1 Tax=Candidatus Kentrum sp. LFY TaxID=2126342 RepID=A0A450WDN3_9GAMM|nr:MAG: hypothetical protein BECKLFY1418C_GA0070996_101313 [Candidatus Kentron sp. LFY]
MFQSNDFALADAKSRFIGSKRSFARGLGSTRLEYDFHDGRFVFRPGTLESAWPEPKGESWSFGKHLDYKDVFSFL